MSVMISLTSSTGPWRGLRSSLVWRREPAARRWRRRRRRQRRRRPLRRRPARRDAPHAEPIIHFQRARNSPRWTQERNGRSAAAPARASDAWNAAIWRVFADRRPNASHAAEHITQRHTASREETERRPTRKRRRDGSRRRATPFFGSAAARGRGV